MPRSLLLRCTGQAAVGRSLPSVSAAAASRGPHFGETGGWRTLRTLLLSTLLLAIWGLQAYDAQMMLGAAQKLGPRAVSGAQVLQELLRRASAIDEGSKLQVVNQFYNNNIQFADDTEVWRQVDYWASPLETFSRGMGDCEDFAIAKYFTLLALGVPTSKLRMVYVRAQLGGVPQAHMVLAYYASPGDEPLILDNLVADVRAASLRPELSPVYSFNTEGLWQGVGAMTAGDPMVRLSRWRELLAKVKAEGF